MAYHSRLTDSVISQARKYDLVIVHPAHRDDNAGQIDQIQAGLDQQKTIAGNEEQHQVVMTATPPPAATPQTISIDGQFDDWTAVPAALTDAAASN